MSMVTYVGPYAFYDCAKLAENIDLSSITEMGVYAFEGCTALTGEIDLSSLDSIPEHAFRSDSGITGIKFSESLTNIGASAFDRCTHIQSLEFPDTLQSIGDAAFWNCWLNGDETEKTTTVDKGAAVVTRFETNDTYSTIEEMTFTGKTLVIPDNVTSIGSSVFEYSYIDYFVIGTGLTGFDGQTFASYSLQAVIMDNFQNNINVENRDKLWLRLNEESKDNDVAVIFRDGGIAADTDDIVSYDENNPFNGMTLQKAVNAVANGSMEGPITITKNIILNETLNVPAGEAVVINTDEGYRMTGKGDITTLITVSEGA